MTCSQFVLEHVLPVAVAGGVAWVARGRVAARTAAALAAANAAKDVSAEAALKKLRTADFEEDTRH